MEENKNQDGKIEERIKKIARNEKVLIGIILALVLIFAIISFKPDLIRKTFAGDDKIKIEIVKIANEECKDCFDLTQVIGVLEQNTNLEIKNEKTLEYNSEEAGKLIEKYGISKVPALIVLGKVNKIDLDKNLFRVEGKTAIFDTPVPYFDLASKEVKGIVSLVEVYDSSCRECASLSRIKDSLENMGIKFNSYELVSASSEQGKKIIGESTIENLPSLLTSKNIEEYWWAFPGIETVFEDKGENYLFKEKMFPYKEISTGKIKGKVKLTYIENKSCEDCFNVTELKQAFQNLGVYIDSEKYVDVSSGDGKSLITTYNITAIPTVILSEEINDYEKIKSILERVGTYENNKYIFRNLDALKVKYQKIGG